MTVTLERITTRLVSLPLAEPIRHPFLGARTQFATLVVQVHCSDGCSGLGYVSIDSPRLVRACDAIIGDLAGPLKGMDVLQRELVWDRMWKLTVDLLHEGAVNLAIAAIDVALWDICGKQAKLPLWKLLGGYRDKVPAYASWTLWRHMTAAELESESAKVVAAGYKAMKLRLGGGRSLAEDTERARLVRRTVGPDVGIMVDALWGLTPTEGVRMARMLGELDYVWLEEPVREGDFAGLAQVRAAQALPIAAGERLSRASEVNQLLPCVDHAILDAHHLGGITPWLKAAAILDTANVPISTHSHPAVHAHLLGTMRTGAWLEYMDWWNAIFTEPLEPKDGFVPLTGKPGLGLELDERAMTRFAL